MTFPDGHKQRRRRSYFFTSQLKYDKSQQLLGLNTLESTRRNGFTSLPFSNKQHRQRAGFTYLKVNLKAVITDNAKSFVGFFFVLHQQLIKYASLGRISSIQQASSRVSRRGSSSSGLKKSFITVVGGVLRYRFGDSFADNVPDKDENNRSGPAPVQSPHHCRCVSTPTVWGKKIKSSSQIFFFFSKLTDTHQRLAYTSVPPYKKREPIFGCSIPGWKAFFGPAELLQPLYRSLARLFFCFFIDEPGSGRRTAPVLRATCPRTAPTGGLFHTKHGWHPRPVSAPCWPTQAGKLPLIRLFSQLWKTVYVTF